MGFNYQQYELNDNNNWSNASGRFCGFIINKRKKAECEMARTQRLTKRANFSLKDFFGIGDGKIFGKVINKRQQAYSEGLKRAEQRQAIADAQKAKENSWINIDGDTENNVVLAKKSNTNLYIGIGVLAILGFLIFRKK